MTEEEEYHTLYLGALASIGATTMELGKINVTIMANFAQRSLRDERERVIKLYNSVGAERFTAKLRSEGES